VVREGVERKGGERSKLKSFERDLTITTEVMVKKHISAELLPPFPQN